MDLTLNKIVGANIKTLRIHANMTQGKIADLLQITPGTVSLYESGERSVPLEYLLTFSRIFNISVDALLSSSTFTNREEPTVYFEHFIYGNSTIYTSSETKLSNPYSMYFTLADTNGDTLVFLRTTEVTEGLMLVSESQLTGDIEKIDVSALKEKRLFLSTIAMFEHVDGKDPIYTYTNHVGEKFVMKNKMMFIYYGYLIARIKHIAKTEEFFAPLPN